MLQVISFLRFQRIWVDGGVRFRVLVEGTRSEECIEGVPIKVDAFAMWVS